MVSHDDDEGFAFLYGTHDWQPIPNCPGRYRLRSSTLGPNALFGDSPIYTEHTVAGARDPVIVALVEGGGLISYRRANGMFVHTLGDIDGFARKLRQLGIAPPTR